MELTWLNADDPHRADVDAILAISEAAREVDCPHEAATTARSFRAFLRYGWDGDPSEVALARDELGRAVGWLDVTLLTWDNTHLGIVEFTVEPRYRRQGFGRQLFQAGVEKVRAAGRTVVLCDAWTDSPGTHFAQAMGMERASDALQRRLDLTALDRPRLEQEYAEAERLAHDYELVRIAGAVPEDMVDAVVRMSAAINDAPIDELDVEDEVFSPERLRAFERSQAAQGHRNYRLVARHRGTGELAGHTMVGVDEDRPWLGWQYDTSVVREHRGHRLGLLLKVGMLLWLEEEEPGLRVIDTWNAASNDHMIRVNEILGCFVVSGGSEWQLHVGASEGAEVPQQASAGQATASVGAP